MFNEIHASGTRVGKAFFRFNALHNYHRFWLSTKDYPCVQGTGKYTRQSYALADASAFLKYSFSSATGSPLDI